MNSETARRVILTLMSGMLSFAIARANAREGSLGPFDGHGDIGAPAVGGVATYDVANQEYTITAAGTRPK